MSKLIIANLDEMVFESREQRYGAYELRTNYPKRLSLAVAVMSTGFVLAVFGPIWYQALFSKETAIVSARDLPAMVVLDHKLDKIKDPDIFIPPPPPPRPQVRSISFPIPEPTKEEDLDEDNTIVEMDELNDAPNISLKDTDGKDEFIFFPEEPGTGTIPQVISEYIPGDEIFIDVSEEPVPVNMEEIRKAIGYPQQAIDAGIEGTVMLRILVDKSGNYVKHKVVNTINPILSRACEAQMSKLHFTPAIQGNKPVYFWVNVPFRFNLAR